MRVKEAYYRGLENDFELELGYMEWLRDNFSEPDDTELDEMGENFTKSSTGKNRIITHNCLIPANNIDFFPPYSA